MQAQAILGTSMFDGILHAAFAHGICIFILVSAFGGISGGHINPAVTLGVALVGKINPLHAVFYILSQLAGGFLGALLVRLSIPPETFQIIYGGATLCSPGVNWMQGLIAETMTTFMLVQSVLLTAVDTDRNGLAALAIGFTVLVDVLAAGNISGASMNPGRSFGPNIVGALFIRSTLLPTHFWSLHWIYYIGPAIGAFLAAGIFRFVVTQPGNIEKRNLKF
ncbi:hypothetical protein WR25_12256 [Diploscapter pachys]|uniref:Aquaporin n=1 Tax=Diploscapter pachys TaxID=2018661 RepID=A0A2A2J721_9BILA|nr:hypothetical protein WR25_12256 [Diploscapter pachys]